jgi:hypothetical protein
MAKVERRRDGAIPTITLNRLLGGMPRDCPIRWQHRPLDKVQTDARLLLLTSRPPRLASGGAGFRFKEA